ncbi:MAG: bifunctional 5,10-methylene-tetrahydrofolate dehydrogenase/5,10-methylene-tetrahydrofolate cyclohydrolase [Dehalococcoidia bacterium]|nr:bifunctional 5,10-methylene-tetrahydrofolate dehydrogenase/5,10-methylene-tetrahydrofolate cyclohydrolase [Dehalococcoidia bacterium]
MPGVILDGRKMSAEIRAELRSRVEMLLSKGVTPSMTGFLVGADPASASYVSLKEKAAGEVGLRAEMRHLPESCTPDELGGHIIEASNSTDVHGIFVQLPLPAHIDENRVLALIAPEKDIDGFHPCNVGRAWLGQESFVPATPAGIVEMLQRGGFADLRQRHAVIVSADNLVGKPTAALLLQERFGADVTICHPDTPDIERWTRTADLLVVAANKPRFITADMVKSGVIAIDFGSNYVDDPAAPHGQRLVGDIDFEPVREKARAITPVPGGLGPMTVTMLLAHTVLAAERSAGTR